MECEILNQKMVIKVVSYDVFIATPSPLSRCISKHCHHTVINPAEFAKNGYKQRLPRHEPPQLCESMGRSDNGKKEWLL